MRNGIGISVDSDGSMVYINVDPGMAAPSCGFCASPSEALELAEALREAANWVNGNDE